MPVIIVEKNILSDFIDFDIDMILKGEFLGNDRSKVLDYKLRIIPFSSLGNNNGLLVGFKPDYVKIYSEDDFIQKEAIIGIYQGKICNNSNEYNAIIGL